MLEFDGFDWDAGNAEKVERHGVSRAEVEEALFRAVAVFEDPEHSGTEPRIRVLGRNVVGRAVFVVVTYRERKEARLLRPISARYMHFKELAAYGQETPTPFGE